MSTDASLAVVAPMNRSTDKDANLTSDLDILDMTRAMTTTLTESGGDHEQDPDDDLAIAVLRTTTVTKASGDQESDPEEDCVPAVKSGGTRRPLAYRFAEQCPSFPVLDLRFSDTLQMTVSRDGYPLVDLLKRVGNRT